MQVAPPNNQTPPANGSPATTTSTAMVLGTDAFRGALEPISQSAAYDLCELMVNSGQFGLKTPGEAMAKAMYGRNIGMPFMQSMQRLHSIEGKIGVDAESLHALCLKSPLCEFFEPILAECDAEKATFITKRVGRPEQKLTYTIEEAEAAGLVDRGKDDEAKKKSNWNAYRRDMLRARCKATLAKLIYPDVTQGFYSKEELEGLAGSRDPDEIVGEIVEGGPPVERVISVQVAPRNYAGELAALKARLTAATTRSARAEVRAAFDAWDGIEPFRSQFTELYNATRKAAAPPASTEAAPAATPEQPGLMPEGNLFATPPAGAKPDGEGK